MQPRAEAAAAPGARGSCSPRLCSLRYLPLQARESEAAAAPGAWGSWQLQEPEAAAVAPGSAA